MAVCIAAVFLALVGTIGSRLAALQDAGALTAESYREYSLAMQK